MLATGWLSVNLYFKMRIPLHWPVVQTLGTYFIQQLQNTTELSPGHQLCQEPGYVNIYGGSFLLADWLYQNLNSSFCMDVFIILKDLILAGFAKDYTKCEKININQRKKNLSDQSKCIYIFSWFSPSLTLFVKTRCLTSVTWRGCPPKKRDLCLKRFPVYTKCLNRKL